MGGAEVRAAMSPCAGCCIPRKNDTVAGVGTVLGIVTVYRVAYDDGDLQLEDLRRARWRHETPPRDDTVDPGAPRPPLVGERITVYWPAERAHYAGRVGVRRLVAVGPEHRRV